MLKIICSFVSFFVTRLSDPRKNAFEACFESSLRHALIVNSETKKKRKLNKLKAFVCLFVLVCVCVCARRERDSVRDIRLVTSDGRNYANF